MVFPKDLSLGHLFLIYINDLHLTIYNSITHHFADDTNLVCFGKSLKSLNNKINNDLRYLTRWLRANKISLHAGKTEYVLFNSHKPPDHDFIVRLGGRRLTPSHHIKYLGMLIDRNLNFGPQINAVAIELKKANGILARLRYTVPKDVLISVYYALFYSHLNYCIQIWGQNVSTNTSRLQALQNSAVRIMSFADYHAPVDPLYFDLKIIKYEDLLHIHNATFIHSIYHNLLPVSLIDTFAIDFSHAYPTRASARGLINSYAKRTTSFGIKSIRNQCILSWNHCHKLLPDNVTLYDLTASKLKSTLKAFFLNSYVH